MPAKSAFEEVDVPAVLKCVSCNDLHSLQLFALMCFEIRATFRINYSLKGAQTLVVFAGVYG